MSYYVDNGKKYEKMKKVHVSFDDEYVRSIVVEYEGTSLMSHSRGGIGTKRGGFTLSSDEYITEVSGYCKPMISGRHITSLTFKTNKKTYGPYGNKTSNYFSLTAPKDKQIAGFLGTSSHMLYAFTPTPDIDAHFTPVPPPGSIGGITGGITETGSNKGGIESNTSGGVPGTNPGASESDGGSRIIGGDGSKTDSKSTGVPGTNPGASESAGGPRIIGGDGSKTDSKSTGVPGTNPGASESAGGPRIIGGDGSKTDSKSSTQTDNNGTMSWDDGKHTKVKRVQLTFDDAIRSIEVEYEGTSLKSQSRGTIGTKLDGFTLSSDEYITEVNGYWKTTFSGRDITSLTFKTNKKTYGTYGNKTSNYFSINAPKDNQIVGFLGSSSHALNSIDTHFAPVPPPGSTGGNTGGITGTGSNKGGIESNIGGGVPGTNSGNSEFAGGPEMIGGDRSKTDSGTIGGPGTNPGNSESAGGPGMIDGGGSKTDSGTIGGPGTNPGSSESAGGPGMIGADGSKTDSETTGGPGTNPGGSESSGGPGMIGVDGSKTDSGTIGGRGTNPGNSEYAGGPGMIGGSGSKTDSGTIGGPGTNPGGSESAGGPGMIGADGSKTDSGTIGGQGTNPGGSESVGGPGMIDADGSKTDSGTIGGPGPNPGGSESAGGSGMIGGGGSKTDSGTIGGPGTNTGAFGITGSGSNDNSSPQKLEAQGGRGGNQWDDGADHDGVTKIHVTDGGSGIEQIKFDYVKNSQSKHGPFHGVKGRGDTKSFVINHPDEYLVFVEGWYDNSTNIILGIQFKTNTKTSEYFGYPFFGEGPQFSLEVKDKKIIGFHGFADSHLNSLGAYFVPVSPPATKVEAQGGNYGDTFDDGAFDHVRKVYVGQGESGVAYVKFDYEKDGKIETRGYGKMTLLGTEEFEVDSGDYITSIDVYVDKVYGYKSEIVIALTFKTFKGKTSQRFGFDSENKYELKDGKGGKLAGFHGKASDVLYALGAYFTPMAN